MRRHPRSTNCCCSQWGGGGRPSGRGCKHVGSYRSAGRRAPHVRSSWRGPARPALHTNSSSPSPPSSSRRQAPYVLKKWAPAASAGVGLPAFFCESWSDHAQNSTPTAPGTLLEMLRPAKWPRAQIVRRAEFDASYRTPTVAARSLGSPALLQASFCYWEGREKSGARARRRHLAVPPAALSTCPCAWCCSCFWPWPSLRAMG